MIILTLKISSKINHMKDNNVVWVNFVFFPVKIVFIAIENKSILKWDIFFYSCYFLHLLISNFDKKKKELSFRMLSGWLYSLSLQQPWIISKLIHNFDICEKIKKKNGVLLLNILYCYCCRCDGVLFLLWEHITFIYFMNS